MKNSRTIGWQGITVDVPENWRLAYARGTFREGYFRLDDEEGARLEVRWTKSRKKGDLTAAMKRFLTLLKRAARRRGKKLQFSESPLPFTSRAIASNRELQGYSWSTDAHAWGAIWRCLKCKRIVSARRLRLRLPAQFKLKSRRFRAHSSRMEFRVKPRNRLVVACYDLDQPDPEPKKLLRTAAKVFKRTRKRRLKTTETLRLSSHDAIAFVETEPKRRARRRRKRFYGVAFYCPQERRLFILTANDRQRTLVGEELADFRCH